MGFFTGTSAADVVPSVGNVVGQLLANRANKKMAEYQYQKDLEMWNKSNEYNLPANQMKRLQDAGINPNMVFGGGSVSGNTVQSTTPKYQAPRLEAPKMDFNPLAGSQRMMMHQNMQQSQVQIDQAKEATKGIALENALKEASMKSKIQTFIANAKTAGEKALGLNLANKANFLNYQFNQETYGIRKALILQKYDSAAQDIMNKEFLRKMGTNRYNLDLKKFALETQKLPWVIEGMKLTNLLRGEQSGLNKRELQLQGYGTQKSDPWYIRIPTQAVGKVYDKFNKWRNNGWSGTGGSW